MLWETFLTKCTKQVKATVPDGQGGVVTTWTEGDTFLSAIVKNNTAVERVAEKQGVKTSYTVTTPADVCLQFHDIFTRDADNKYFIVTSNYTDSNPPEVASFKFNQVTAEEWTKP